VKLNKGEIMKTTTMYILSGFFGAMFAVACGAVSGVGDKVANAAGGLQKKVFTYDCEPPYTVADYDEARVDDFKARALDGDFIVSVVGNKIGTGYWCDLTQDVYTEKIFYIE
jgi:hypothetical protein